MGYARFCKCGHVSSDHRLRRHIRTICDWDTCECDMYAFYETRNVGRIPERVEPQSMLLRNHFAEDKISNIRDDGTLRR